MTDKKMVEIIVDEETAQMITSAAEGVPLPATANMRAIQIDTQALQALIERVRLFNAITSRVAALGNPPETFAHFAKQADETALIALNYLEIASNEGTPFQ